MMTEASRPLLDVTRTQFMYAYHLLASNLSLFVVVNSFRSLAAFEQSFPPVSRALGSCWVATAADNELDGGSSKCEWAKLNNEDLLCSLGCRRWEVEDDELWIRKLAALMVALKDNDGRRLRSSSVLRHSMY